MTTPRRTLILLRHGKSAYPIGVGDHERPLAPRGEREAGLAGAWIRAHLPPVDAVICSTATRTRLTLAATGITAPVEFESDIYEASPHEISTAIGRTDDSVSTLLVVGHSPGMPWTAWTLAGNRNDLQVAQMSEKFPTSAFAVLTFDGPWADLAPGSAELVHFVVPR